MEEKTIVYTEGPELVTMGVAGIFRKHEPRAIAAPLADQILAKSSITFSEQGE